MEQLEVQNILGAILVLLCGFYAVKYFVQIFWNGLKMSTAIIIAVMVTDLTLPNVKPYLNSATSASIEGALRDFRAYASIVGSIATREITTITTTRS